MPQLPPLKVSKKELLGHTFTLTKMFGFPAIRLTTKLVRLLAPAMTRAFAGMKASDFKNKVSLLSKIDLGQISGAVAYLAEHLTEDEFLTIAKELLSTVIVQGPQLAPTEAANAFDLVFQGNVWAGYELIGWAAWENFGNFSGGGSRGLLGKFAALGAEALATPETSPTSGPAGVS